MLVYPNAKINLGLHVTARRPDGYHDIETVFYPIPLMDALEVKETTAPGRFRQTGAPLDCAAEENLVMRVLRMVEATHPLPPLDIHLLKHIPSGAGLGGGSSDAAFMLRLLNEKFQLGMSADAMLDVLNALMGREVFYRLPIQASSIQAEKIAPMRSRASPIS